MENSPNWLELPPDLTASILLRLGPVDILLSARKVCHTWRRICSQPSMWRILDMRHSAHQIHLIEMDIVIKKAVDLSSGQMMELHLWLERSYGNVVLPYIADREDMRDEGLKEVIAKLPLLEELHLESGSNYKEIIEVAGRCCPKLKSLKLINIFYICPKRKCDEDALAIAENMPGLHHLQLSGPNRITRDGLLAITDSCPHLESLDVLLWINPKAGPELVRKLSQQIKHLRLSYNSAEDSDEYDDLDSLDDDEYDGLYSSDDDDPYGLYNISTDVDETDDLDSTDEDDPSRIVDVNTIYRDYNHSYDYSDFFLGNDIESSD